MMTTSRNHVGRLLCVCVVGVGAFIGAGCGQARRDCAVPVFCVSKCGGPIERTLSCWDIVCPAPLINSSDCECDSVPVSGDPCVVESLVCDGHDMACGGIATMCTCASSVFVCAPAPGCHQEAGADGATDSSMESGLDAGVD